MGESNVVVSKHRNKKKKRKRFVQCTLHQNNPISKRKGSTFHATWVSEKKGGGLKKKPKPAQQNAFIFIQQTD